MQQDVKWDTTLDQLSAALRAGGVFLVTAAGDGRANPMTVGWAQLGIVWGRNVCTVLVRRSRYTYDCLSQRDSFTISVPAVGTLIDELRICGTESGRDMDKIKTCGLTLVPGRVVETPVIGECGLHYECRIVARTQLERSSFDSPDILERFYPAGDYHQVVFGDIVACYGEPRE